MRVFRTRRKTKSKRRPSFKENNRDAPVLKPGIIANSNHIPSLNPVNHSLPNHSLSPGFQSKLVFGKPGDLYETEADRAADSIASGRPVQSITQLPPGRLTNKIQGKGIQKQNEEKKEESSQKKIIQKQEEEKKEETLQKKQNNTSKGKTTPAVESGINALQGKGRPLSRSLKNYYEPRFGYDFSKVRIHDNTRANKAVKSVNAKAFTTGWNVVFGNGQYSPHSPSGKHLLAHELTHVVQQNSGNRAPQLQKKIVFHSWETKKFWFFSFPSIKTKIFTNQEVADYTNNIGVTNHAFDDIISGKGKEYSFIGGKNAAQRKAYRKNLIRDIVKNMHTSSKYLYYKSKKEFETEIRKRAVTSLDMRVTQGKTKKTRPVGYPPRTADSWAAVASTKARDYWNVTIVKGDYNFTLKDPKGKNNAYEALKRLIFSHKTSRNRATLMHCDYLISAIHFKVMAEAMTISKFNKEVRDGHIKIKLQDLSIHDIVQKETESKPNKSLIKIELDSENDLIIGDHLIFYNHPSYDYLNKKIGQSWRLENAIVIDNKGPGNSKRFQGHGYFRPKTRAQFIKDMRRQLRKLVNKAMYAFNRYKRTKSLANEVELRTKFPYIIYKDSFGNILSEPKAKYKDGGTWVETPLSQLKNAPYNHPFASSSTSKIKVYRPMESRINF